jgi:hypothetical protein
MPEFYVTFGQQYPREPHPTFPEAHRDGWATIVAESVAGAREIAVRELGRHWAFIYAEGEIDKSYYPAGELERFDAVGRICRTCRLPDAIKPSHTGSPRCKSGSVASGGKNTHCTCDVCF